MADCAVESADVTRKQELVRICEELMNKKLALEEKIARPRFITFKDLKTPSTSSDIDCRRYETRELKQILKIYKLMGVEVTYQSHEAVNVKLAVCTNGTDNHVHAFELKCIESKYEVGKYFLPPGINGKDIPEELTSMSDIFDMLRRYCLAYYDRSQQIDDLKNFYESLDFEDWLFVSHDKKYVEIVLFFKFLNLAPPKEKVTFILKYKNGQVLPRSVKIICSNTENESALDKAMYIETLKTKFLVDAFKSIVSPSET